MAHPSKITASRWWVLGVVGLAASGCGAASERPEGDESEYTEPDDEAQADDGLTDDLSEPTNPPNAGCIDGTVQECRIEIREVAGVKNCAVGLELCEDGVWSACSRAEDIEAKLDAAADSAS